VGDVDHGGGRSTGRATPPRAAAAVPHAAARALARVLALVLAGGGAACALAGCASTPPPRVVEWTLAFYLPYDNDLAPLAAEIEAQVRAGLTGERAAATLLVDGPGEADMRRVSVGPGGAAVERLAGDDATDPAVFESFLRWTAATRPARHYALFLLGHGGRAGEIGVDRHRGPGRAAGWADAEAFGAALRRLAADLAPARLEVLVLQQCGRGSVEALWPFRATAPLVLASETFVGAPNTYYRPLGEAVSTRPLVEPSEVARLVLAHDRHAATLAVLDGARIAAIPAALDRLAAALDPTGRARLARPADRAPAYVHDGEAAFDLCEWARALGAANGAVEADVDRAVAWFSGTLVRSQRFRPVDYGGVEFPVVDRAWCGVAANVPTAGGAAGGAPAFPHAPQWADTLARLAPPRVLLGPPSVTSAPAPGSADAGGRLP
jgi:hypothetical protein